MLYNIDSANTWEKKTNYLCLEILLGAFNNSNAEDFQI